MPYARGLQLLVRAGRGAVLLIVLMLALIGLLQLTRGTAVRHVRGVGSEDTLAVSAAEFPQLVAMLTGAALMPGNRVEIALNGDKTYQRLLDDVRSARESITLQVYYGAAGSLARALRDILIDRARAGVRVYVLYDAFGTSGMPDEERDPLRAAGARVEPFRPIRLSTLHLAQNRSHVRGITIDRRIGWTGGFGIDDRWLGDGHSNGSWRDTNVRFEGPAVNQLLAGFAAGWVEATGELFSGRASLAPQAGDVVAGLLYTSPTLGSTAAERFFAMSLAGARKTIYLTNSYFAPDAAFIELLASAAKRGVDVRILTGGSATDVYTVTYAGRASYEALLAAGVRVYEWLPTTMHAKTFVVDGQWSTIGSMNFDNRSMALNDEATLMILDAATGAQMDQTFRDDLGHAREITLDEFSRRSWLERLSERGARLLMRLL